MCDSGLIPLSATPLAPANPCRLALLIASFAFPVFAFHTPPRIAYFTHLGPISGATAVASDRNGYAYVAGLNRFAGLPM